MYKLLCNTKDNAIKEEYGNDIIKLKKFINGNYNEPPNGYHILSTKTAGTAKEYYGNEAVNLVKFLNGNNPTKPPKCVEPRPPRPPRPERKNLKINKITQRKQQLEQETENTYLFTRKDKPIYVYLKDDTGNDLQDHRNLRVNPSQNTELRKPNVKIEKTKLETDEPFSITFSVEDDDSYNDLTLTFKYKNPNEPPPQPPPQLPPPQGGLKLKVRDIKQNKMTINETDDGVYLFPYPDKFITVTLEHNDSERNDIDHKELKIDQDPVESKPYKAVKSKITIKNSYIQKHSRFYFEFKLEEEDEPLRVTFELQEEDDDDVIIVPPLLGGEQKLEIPCEKVITNIFKTSRATVKLYFMVKRLLEIIFNLNISNVQEIQKKNKQKKTIICFIDFLNIYLCMYDYLNKSNGGTSLMEKIIRCLKDGTELEDINDDNLMDKIIHTCFTSIKREFDDKKTKLQLKPDRFKKLADKKYFIVTGISKVFTEEFIKVIDDKLKQIGIEKYMEDIFIGIIRNLLTNGFNNSLDDPDYLFNELFPLCSLFIFYLQTKYEKDTKRNQIDQFLYNVGELVDTIEKDQQGNIYLDNMIFETLEACNDNWIIDFIIITFNYNQPIDPRHHPLKCLERSKQGEYPSVLIEKSSNYDDLSSSLRLYANENFTMDNILELLVLSLNNINNLNYILNLIKCIVSNNIWKSDSNIYLKYEKSKFNSIKVDYENITKQNITYTTYIKAINNICKIENSIQSIITSIINKCLKIYLKILDNSKFRLYKPIIPSLGIQEVFYINLSGDEIDKKNTKQQSLGVLEFLILMYIKITNQEDINSEIEEDIANYPKDTTEDKIKSYFEEDSVIHNKIISQLGDNNSEDQAKFIFTIIINEIFSTLNKDRKYKFLYYLRHLYDYNECPILNNAAILSIQDIFSIEILEHTHYNQNYLSYLDYDITAYFLDIKMNLIQPIGYQEGQTSGAEAKQKLKELKDIFKDYLKICLQLVQKVTQNDNTGESNDGKFKNDILRQTQRPFKFENLLTYNLVNKNNFIIYLKKICPIFGVEITSFSNEQDREGTVVSEIGGLDMYETDQDSKLIKINLEDIIQSEGPIIRLKVTIILEEYFKDIQEIAGYIRDFIDRQKLELQILEDSGKKYLYFSLIFNFPR